MNTRKFLVSILMLVSVLFSACAPAVTPLAPTPVPPTSTRTVIPSTSTPTAKPLPEHVIAEWKMHLPEVMAIGFDSVWILGHHEPKNTLRIDPVSNKEIAIIEDTGYAHSILIVGDAVWIDGNFDDMAKIDPKTNSIVARVAGAHMALAAGFDSIWSTTTKDALDRIDPTTTKIIASIKLGDNYTDNNNGVMVTASAVWVDHVDEGELIKIDPTTNSIVSKTSYSKLIDQAKAQTTVPPGKGTNFIWLLQPDPANPQGCGLLQIDPNTGTGLNFRSVGADCNPVTVTDNSVWLSGNAQIDRLNLTTNQIDATYKLQPGLTNLGIGFGSIWVMSEPLGFVQRLDIAP